MPAGGAIWGRSGGADPDRVAWKAVIAGVFAGGAGEAADGDIRRRDPLDLPLLQSDEWRESLTSVILNGETVTEGCARHSRA